MKRTAAREHTRTRIDDVVLSFLQVVWQMEHALESASKRMEDTIGITGPQRLVLRVIGTQPGISAGKLAGTLHLHPSTVTGMLQRLEAGGYLRRRANWRDRRSIELQLTPAGSRMNRPSQGRTVEHAARNTLAKCDLRKRSAALAVLTHFTHELKKL